METKDQELYERLLKEFLEWQAKKAKQEQEKALREEILGYLIQSDSFPGTRKESLSGG